MSSSFNTVAEFNKLSIQATASKAYLQDWAVKLSSPVNAIDVMQQLYSHCKIVGPMFAAWSAVVGMDAYGQAQFNDATFSPATIAATVATNCGNLIAWIDTNIPGTAVFYQNGVLTGNTYTAVQVAPILGYVNAIISVIP